MDDRNTRQIGKLGEDIAVDYLTENNYRICARNVYTLRGEIDIVSYDNANREYAFIEVKYRKNLQFGYPAEGIAGKKMNHLRDAINIFIKLYFNGIPDLKYRMDLIEIIKEDEAMQIRHLKNI